MNLLKLHRTWYIRFFFFVSLLVPFFIYAKDLSSTNFIIRDPIVGTGGEYGTSSGFKLFGAGDTLLTGSGVSATYISHYGFLYFPYVTKDTLTATAGIAKVDLAWGASTAGLGFSVSGYKTGIALVSGGPYTYTSVGNVTSYSYTSLAPGYYCFIVQTLDAFGNVVGGTSNESCDTVVPSLSLAVSTSSIGFGSLTAGGPRYATTSGGSGSNSLDAHTIIASSGAPSGYTITYNGSTLMSGGNTITPATITGSATGVIGTKQFALSVSTTGGATIPSVYQQSSLNWSFVANTTTLIASTSSITSAETYGLRYITNISNTTPAGQYATNLTYVITGNF